MKQDDLQHRLKGIYQEHGSILYMGIGNQLKKDDGVGVYISEWIQSTHANAALTAEMSIENYMGKVNRLNPGALVFIDSMELGKPPGTYALMNIEKVMDTCTNTHNISLKKVAQFFNMQTYILGIQPADINYGYKLTKETKKAADELIDLIGDLLENVHSLQKHKI